MFILKLFTMKNISTNKIIALGAIMLFSLTAIKAQNFPPLQKYTNESLYSSKTDFQVAGNWKGAEFQYDRSKTFIEEKFDYELQLTQEGNRITGTSLITDAMGNHSKTKLRGFVLGAKLYFEEYAVEEQVMNRANTIWCLTTGELLIVIKDNRVFLSGTLDGYAASPYACNQTYVTLEAKSNDLVNKAETPSLTAKTQGELVSTFLDSRNQMNAYPNPFREEITISFSPDITGEVTLDVIDITGKKIATLINAQTPANSNQVKFRPDKEASTTGIYFAVLKANGKVYSKQLLQVK